MFDMIAALEQMVQINLKMLEETMIMVEARLEIALDRISLLDVVVFEDPGVEPVVTLLVKRKTLILQYVVVPPKIFRMLYM